MQIIDVNNATPQLAALIQSAVAGDDIVISKENGVMVRLTPIVFDSSFNKPAQRVGGQLRGMFEISDNFDEFDAELEDMFYNSKIFPDEEKK